MILLVISWITKETVHIGEGISKLRSSVESSQVVSVEVFIVCHHQHSSIVWCNCKKEACLRSLSMDHDDPGKIATYWRKSKPSLGQLYGFIMRRSSGGLFCQLRHHSRSAGNLLGQSWHSQNTMRCILLYSCRGRATSTRFSLSVTTPAVSTSQLSPRLHAIKRSNSRICISDTRIGSLNTRQ